MKPQLLLVAFAVLAVLTALPLAESKGLVKGASAASWPCCDNCTALCNRAQPPQCRCGDVSPTGCHPECTSCQKTSAGYQCMTFISCKNKCTKAA
ncbi:hypothetical protein ACP70R_036441 [Stipagrostis hirtigluma subsp. patula]